MPEKDVTPVTPPRTQVDINNEYTPVCAEIGDMRVKTILNLQKIEAKEKELVEKAIGFINEGEALQAATPKAE